MHVQLAVNDAIHRRRHPLPGHALLAATDRLEGGADFDLDQGAGRQTRRLRADGARPGLGLVGELDRAHNGTGATAHGGGILPRLAVHDCPECGELCDCDGEDHGQAAPDDCCDACEDEDDDDDFDGDHDYDDQ